MPNPRAVLVRKMRRLAAQAGPAAHAFLYVAEVVAADVPPEPRQTHTPTPRPVRVPPLPIVPPPGDPETGVVYVVIYDAGRWMFQKATVGKQNSGGAGFRALVVPNGPK